MVRNFFVVILAYAGIAAYAFTGKHGSEKDDTRTMITGRVSPADGVNVVWVISGKDSLKAPTSAGLFSFEVKPGVHNLVVDAVNPYKDVVMDNLTVSENEVLDVGEIVLKQ
jgi:hypothetical protein